MSIFNTLRSKILSYISFKNILKSSTILNNVKNIRYSKFITSSLLTTLALSCLYNPILLADDNHQKKKFCDDLYNHGKTFLNTSLSAALQSYNDGAPLDFVINEYSVNFVESLFNSVSEIQIQKIFDSTEKFSNDKDVNKVVKDLDVILRENIEKIKSAKAGKLCDKCTIDNITDFCNELSKVRMDILEKSINENRDKSLVDKEIALKSEDLIKRFKLTKSQTEASIAHYLSSSNEFRKLFENITTKESEHYFNTIAKQTKVSPQEVKYIYRLKDQLRSQGKSEEDIINYMRVNQNTIKDDIKKLIEASKMKK